MKAEKAELNKSRATIKSNLDVLEVKISLHFVSVNRYLCVHHFEA